MNNAERAACIHESKCDLSSRLSRTLAFSSSEKARMEEGRGATGLISVLLKGDCLHAHALATYIYYQKGRPTRGCNT